MNSSTVTLNVNTVRTFVAVKPTASAPFVRTLAHKWDMVAVVTLMLSSAAYGIYALTCLTAF